MAMPGRNMWRMMRSAAGVAAIALLVGLQGYAAEAFTLERQPAERRSGPRIGEPAPEFTVTDTEGKEHTLSDYKGKIVVLEWFNGECPFVVKQHKEGPLKDQGNKAIKDGEVVWIAIVTGRAGKQGTGTERNAEYRDEWNMAYPIALDETTEVGRLYGATNTPHMFVIDQKGVLQYKGAIDNAPMGRIKGGGDEFINYVEDAIEAIKAGETVPVTETQAYGCTVKY